jgi:ATP-dependent RNA helicase HelY
MSTPAQRYAAVRRRQPNLTPGALSTFRELYDFEFDDFQVRACEALERGDGVLVAAPTGSGKTVIGEFAVHLALAGGRKCFYTAPIKALSNQKYADLAARYGPEQVGLLTGDNSVNGEAPVVVMTTEVLRNMLYAGSGTLGGLSYVVLDEVHYLADRFRGAVWEEVIIHLPESVRVVALSATVSNAEEFGEWLVQVRGDTEVIVDEHRPVPLWQHMMVDGHLYDLFTEDHTGDGTEAPGKALAGAARQQQHRSSADARREPGRQGRAPARVRVSPELLQVTRRYERAAGPVRPAGRPRRGGHNGGRPRRIPRPPSRPDVIARLDSEGLLPAITFIFSRTGCNAAVQQCLHSGLRLTTPDEAARIRQVAEARTAEIDEQDLTALGYGEWLAGLERGLAAHHAGLLPTFKVVVEELFTEGLIRAVFATETLALGINMPARTVVIERLDKWNGEMHAELTPGEYTQLTGRAGRRGIDVEGHAVVLWHPGVDPAAVAGLASTRTYQLNSSFRPSYNMAVNLVGQVGRERARALLESSFAQFQADRAVVGLARQLRRSQDALSGYAKAMTCDAGDFAGYAALRQQLSEREAEMARSRSAARKAEAARSLEGLQRGDVIRVPGGRRAGIAVVLDPDGPQVLTANRQVKRLSAADFPVPAEAVERVRIPGGFSPRSPRHRRDLAATVRNRMAGRETPKPARDRPPGNQPDAEVQRLRAEIRQHPCHACPEREDHARWAERYYRLKREVAGLERRVAGRSHVIARTFDRVCGVLEQLGYLDGEQVTQPGRMLAGLYTELDLLAAECLRAGLWEGLNPAELAACVSALTYEARRADDAAARMPPGSSREVLNSMIRLWGELDTVERDNRLSFLREPDLGFAWAAWRWARGHRLDAVLYDADLTAGDFVRAVKQLLDLLDQVAAIAEPAIAGSARDAMGAMRRGVVAYSSVA